MQDNAISKSSTKIVIVGAGIGGLTAALALLQRGYQVTVYEQASELGEVGAGVQLSPNAVAVLASLGLLDDLRAVANEPQAKIVRLWNTGQSWPLFELGPHCLAKYGLPYLLIHRGDLHQALVRGVQKLAPDCIVTKARLVDLAETPGGVTARFENGQTATADLLVGADGVHSRVRHCIFGEGKASFTGCSLWRGVIPVERLPAHLHTNVGTNWVGPGHHVITYPIRKSRLINFGAVVESDEWDGQESWTLKGAQADCEADFAGWHEDILTYIRSIDVHYRWALLSRPTLSSWHAGRTVLLGDACHPMLPFMAQGAAMAIEDGLILARAIDESGADLDHAIQTYERNRITRANKCVEASEKNRELFHNSQLNNEADAQAYVDRQWDKDAIFARYEWLFAYDPVHADLGEAVR